MSLAAILWALEQAPVDTPSEALVLVCLAERTGGSDGRGAYPSVQWIAERARLQPRQVQNILRKLSDGQVIRPGRQSMVEHIPVDRRPRVWDLNLSLTRGALQYTPDADVDLDGVHSSTERGAITPPSGVQPSAPKPTTNQLQNRGARGTRLPDEWFTEDMRDFARAEGLSDRQIARLSAEFADYWRAIPGQKGVKLDWLATWRNNIRSKIDRGLRPEGRTPLVNGTKIPAGWS